MIFATVPEELIAAGTAPPLRRSGVRGKGQGGEGCPAQSFSGDTPSSSALAFSADERRRVARDRPQFRVRELQNAVVTQSRKMQRNNEKSQTRAVCDPNGMAFAVHSSARHLGVLCTAT